MIYTIKTIEDDIIGLNVNLIQAVYDDYDALDGETRVTCLALKSSEAKDINLEEEYYIEKALEDVINDINTLLLKV